MKVRNKLFLLDDDMTIYIEYLKESLKNTLLTLISEFKILRDTKLTPKSITILNTSNEHIKNKKHRLQLLPRN